MRRAPSPTTTAWERAASVVRAGYQPGDLITFAPDWIDPVGRLHLGDLIPVEMAGRMDAARYGRIWEVSIRGAHAPETAGLAPVETTPGEVVVRRFEQTPAVVLADFATLTPSSDGARATRELAEVGFAPHECLQVTPVPHKPTKLTFAHVQLGTMLVGHVGLADVFTRRDIRAPGRLVVEIAGQRVADVTPGVDDGWVRFEAKTTPWAPPDVVIGVSAEVDKRQICFAIEARQ